METHPSSDHPASDFSDTEGSEYAGPARGKKKIPAPALPLPSPAPAKKARTTAQTSKPARKGRGKVKIGGKIAEFPLDVLYEILSYAEPSDLLSMSRVNTSHRDALTTKSSRFVWKNAIENAEMPPCPEDISEIHYAHFAFDPYCDYCHTTVRKGQILNYDYHAREKACKLCVATEFEEIDSWDFYYRLVPTIIIQCKVRRGYRIEVHAHSRKMKEIHEKLQSFGSDNVACQEWKASMKAEAKKLYQLEQPLKAWFTDKEAEGMSKKEDLRQARLEAILEKLNEEGYGEELQNLKEGRIDGMYSLKNHKGVKIAASLTQKAWEKMKPDLIVFMEGVRERWIAEKKRMEEARAAELRRKAEDRNFPLLIKAFSDCISARPHDPYGPQCADIAGLPEIQALLQTPFEEQLDKEDFVRCLETSFDSFKSSWRASVEEKLLKMMQEKIPEATADDLWSPAAMFSCIACNAWLHTSCTFAHTKCTSRYNGKFGSRLPTAPWEQASLKFNHEAYLKAILALQKFESTPTTNMLSLELFHCLDCSQRKDRRVLISGKEAIQGSSSCIFQGHLIQPVTLTSEEEKLKDLYVDMKLSISSYRQVVCASCRELVGIGDSKFEQHQTGRHDKTQDLWIEGVDFYRTNDILQVVSFADEFVPNDTDIRSAIFKFARKTYSRLSIDLRTNSRFAAENYCYPGRG